MYGPKIQLKFSRRDPFGEKKGEEISLELRPPKDEQLLAKLYTEWINDNRVRLYLSTPIPCTESYELGFVKDQCSKEGKTMWIIYCGDQAIGNVGINGIDLVNKRAELGIMIGDKSFWGKGIASAVEATVLEYGFSNIVAGGLNKISAGVLTGNIASQKALEKVGFAKCSLKKQEYWFQGKWFDLWEGEILQSKWKKVRKQVFERVGITELSLYPGCEEEGYEPVVIKQ